MRLGFFSDIHGNLPALEAAARPWRGYGINLIWPISAIGNYAIFNGARLDSFSG